MSGERIRKQAADRAARPKLRHLLHMDDAQEMTMLDFDKCWAAVESRDAGADGSFFYGVRTTGVYCRPGCPSRRPLRANTAFFATIAEAEAAGLRACKRCRPTDASTASRHVAAIEKACALLAHQRDDAEPRRARRCGGDQPVSFSPGVQAGHRRHPARLCPHPPARRFAQTARQRRESDRGDLWRGVRVELARL